jgi:hypothetical protein
MRQDKVKAVIARQGVYQLIRDAHEGRRKLFEMLDNMGEEGRRLRERMEPALEPLPPLPGEMCLAVWLVCWHFGLKIIK